MKIKDLVRDWPPQPGGAFDRGYTSPQDLNVPVSEVGPVRNENVACKCFYMGQPHTFDLPVENREIAEKLAALVRENLGKTVQAIGELELEVEMSEAT
jgi:hypothetical protein